MTIVYNHKRLKPIKRILRKQEVGAEKVLWSKLRNRRQNFKFRRQYGIGNYVIDFYCPKLKLAIEIDGATHSTEEEIKKDKEREEFIKKFGIKIKRYYNNDVYKNIDEVLINIHDACIKRQDELKKLVRDKTQPHPIPLLTKERGIRAEY